MNQKRTTPETRAEPAVTRRQAISAAFPYRPHFTEVISSKMHYVDEGQGDPFLLLHANPTSSYLWRNVVPHLTPLGRVIAPDLIGMGRSDKPDLEYRLANHIRYLEAFIEKLSLKNLTLVIHDWGSALGFHYTSRHESNVKGLAFMEAILMPAPSWDVFPPAFTQIFKQFRTPEVGWNLIVNQNFFIEQILPRGIVRMLTEEEHNFYRAPFKDPATRKPLWRWPNEIPIAGEPADVTALVAAYNAWLQQTSLPKLLLTATPGAIITAQAVDWARRSLKNLRVVDLGPGIHYLQEDHPAHMGQEIASWYKQLVQS